MISGTTNVEDTQIRGANVDHNFGGYGEVVTGDEYHTLIRAKNVASELGGGATITACICSMYVQPTGINGADEIFAYRIFKPWVEGPHVSPTTNEPGATWNDWDNDDWEWATAGCQNADDGGSDNSGDGTDADRKSTAESSQNVTTENTWYGWNVSTELAQGWYDGTINEEGIILLGDNAFQLYYSTEYTDDPSLCPFWTFTYTVEEEEEKKNRRRRIIIGERDETTFNARIYSHPSWLW